MNWRLNLMALLPKNALSSWVGWAVRRKWPFGGHTWLRDTLIRMYAIHVDEAEKPLSEYPTFGEFFIRKLKPGARPISASELVSPVDGLLTSRGVIQEEGKLLQAKGMDYALQDFLPGSAQEAAAWAGGVFLTLYLAPYNYHRIHSPCAMRVEKLVHVPGALWPVNAWSVAGLANLFVRNDRVMAHGRSGEARIVVAMIGATNVGRITLDALPGFHANTRTGDPAYELPLPKGPLHLGKGEGLGCFEMGSTVILLLSREWVPRLAPWVLAGEPRIMRMGESLVA